MRARVPRALLAYEWDLWHPVWSLVVVHQCEVVGVPWCVWASDTAHADIQEACLVCGPTFDRPLT